MLNSVDAAEHAAGAAPVAGDVSQADSDMIASVSVRYLGHCGVRAPFGSPLAANLPQSRIIWSDSSSMWHVLFEVPADFEVDRVSFSPSYGDHVATVWTM